MSRRFGLPALLALVLTSCPGCYPSQSLPGEIAVVESAVLTNAISRLPFLPGFTQLSRDMPTPCAVPT